MAPFLLISPFDRVTSVLYGNFIKGSACVRTKLKSTKFGAPVSRKEQKATLGSWVRVHEKGISFKTEVSSGMVQSFEVIFL